MKEYNNVIIERQNNEGNGICKIDNKITFIPYTLSNEIINLNIICEHKNYNDGKLLKIIKPSSERCNPLCPYYYKCGGCNLMHEQYKYQLDFKKEKVINNLKHIANIDLNKNIEIIYNKELNYRNHITLSVNKDIMGFYENNSNDIVDIDKCLISNNKINKKIEEIKEFIKIYKNNNIEKVIIKAYNSVMINVISKNFELIEEFKKHVKCDSFYINNKYIYGLKKVSEKLNNYTFNVSPLSFFQKNTDVTVKLYDYIKSFISKSDSVLDLYCGTGTIGIYISSNAKKVIGIEIIDDGIKDAKENALINNVNNIEFISGSVENNINNITNINAIIVDPPRPGLSKTVINTIMNINVEKLIYVSCNSSTLSRDLKILSNKYDIVDIKLFDMFPNTSHVECACVLRLH